jgi:hypothetical protein
MRRTEIATTDIAMKKGTIRTPEGMPGGTGTSSNGFEMISIMFGRVSEGMSTD